MTGTENRTERGIIFTGPSIRAILAGKKTQTRRVVRWKPREEGLNLGFSGLDPGFYCSDVEATGWVLRSRDGRGTWNDRTYPLHCPFGRTGGRLWVRESWVDCGGYYRFPSTDDVNDVRKIRSPRTLPKSISRIALDLLQVRVERLNEITEEDAIAEGVDYISVADVPRQATWSRRTDFAHLWDKINSKRGYPWKSNPFVWVLTFRKV